jgi:hypothetical protein
VRRVTKACADARHLTAITSRQSCLQERKEAKIMNLKHLPLGAGLAALALAAGMAVPAGAADELHASAIKACSSASAHGPATVVTAIGDGRGGSLVWLTDADANLWLCSADTDGHIYAYPMITATF